MKKYGGESALFLWHEILDVFNFELLLFFDLDCIFLRARLDLITVINT